MFSSFLPKGAPFFELLLKQNNFLCTVASIFADSIENLTKIDQPHQRIATLETEADLLHIEITKHLSHTFITPIDREDILHITKVQEETIDIIHSLASRIYILGLHNMHFPMVRLARTLHGMALVTSSMLEGLSQKRDSHNTKDFLELKHESETLLNSGIGELHDVENPTPEVLLQVLKWSQAYDRMEMAIHQISELAEVIEEAVLKNV